jgi:hypothetical protein
MASDSLQSLWDLYRKTELPPGTSERDIELARTAFYSGMVGVLKVLGHAVESGEVPTPAV